MLDTDSSANDQANEAFPKHIRAQKMHQWQFGSIIGERLFYRLIPNMEGPGCNARLRRRVCEQPSVALVGLEHRGVDGFDGRADPEL